MAIIRLLDQFRWISEIRGGTVPKQTQQIFEQIQMVAHDKNIDFLELCTKECPKVAKIALEAVEKQLQTVRAIANGQDRKKATPDEIADGEQALSAAIATACGFAMDCSDWEKLGDYADEWLAKSPNDACAQSSLAIALFGQGRVADALSIYKRSLDLPENNGQFEGDVASLDESKDVVNSLKRIYLLSKENNVSFPDLIEYAFSEQILANAIKELKEADEAFLKNKSDSDRRELATDFNTAAHYALYSKRWTDAENLARKSVELKNSSGHIANANLATAWLFQGKYEQALEIYRKYWMDPCEGKALGDVVLADFEQLERMGIEHPDVSRIKAALGKTANTAPSSTDMPKAVTRP